MGVVTIKSVRRESAKLVIALAGQTGDGKTYSALQLALGLAGMDPSKVGLLDTENRRGSLYADIYDPVFQKPSPFLIGDFPPPFSPGRYVDAMQEMAASGIEVLVIDSVSHEHEGQGGLEEIAHRPKADGSPRKVADWLGAKREHRRFMNTMLCLPCHVIACFRAREKMDFRNPDKPVSKGIQPICEKNVMFESTASFMMREQGKSRDIIKLPECLRPILGNLNSYLTPAHGEQLRKWVGGSGDDERVSNELRLAASNGTDALVAAWKAITNQQRQSLAGLKDSLKDLAKSVDDERLDAAQAEHEEEAHGSELEAQAEPTDPFNKQ